MPETAPDFAALCAAVKAWRQRAGWTQEEVTRRGGPSEPTLRAIEGGAWASSRPQATLKKIDVGLEWPDGTAFRVLHRRFDPMATESIEDSVDALLDAIDAHLSRHDPTVGGRTQDVSQYVESPGDRVDHGEPESETAAAIRAMREDLRVLAEHDEQREAQQRTITEQQLAIFEQLNSVSSRLERWELERAKSVDRARDED
jgi:transcriptional regulator with XRE-family HTH domain